MYLPTKMSPLNTKQRPTLRPTNGELAKYCRYAPHPGGSERLVRSASFWDIIPRCMRVLGRRGPAHLQGLMERACVVEPRPPEPQRRYDEQLVGVDNKSTGLTFCRLP